MQRFDAAYNLKSTPVSMTGMLSMQAIYCFMEP